MHQPPFRLPAGALDRRRLLAGAAAGGGLILGAPLLRAAPVTEPGVVRTQGGLVRGAMDGGVHVFRGIPYGADTGSARRFLPPAPAPRWRGVRPALAFGSRAPQLAPPGAPATSRGPVQGEDCLVLNIWTPGLPSSRPTGAMARRPVMVWFHGGGFALGGGDEPVNDGVRLCRRRDVVLVTINHRLNAFGYLHFGSLAKAGEAISNAGQLDGVAALRWVRDNIAAFGGDPGNVTVFGQSGGGSKVAALLAMPAARGLFHRAILESGFGTYTIAPADAEAQTAAIIRKLGLEPGAPGTIAALRAVPAARLLEALQAVTGGDPTKGPGVVADGVVVPNTPFGPGAPPPSPDVPLLVCHTATETTGLFAPPGAFDLDWAQLPAMLAGKVRDPAPLIAGWRALRPAASASDVYFQVTTELGMGRNARIAADLRAGQGAPVFAALLDWRAPGQGGRMRSPHGLELPLVFDTVGSASGLLGPDPAGAQALADVMSAAWTNFARTGNPNGSAVPHWPAYDLPRRATMVFDSASAARPDPLGAEQALIEQALA